MDHSPKHLAALGQTWKFTLSSWGVQRLKGWLQTVTRNLPRDCDLLDDGDPKLDRTPVQVEVILRVSLLPPASLPQAVKHEVAYEPDPRD